MSAKASTGKSAAPAAQPAHDIHFYRQIIESSNDVIYTHDLEGNFTDINPAGERMSGYTRAEIIGMNTAQVLSAADLKMTRERIADKIAGKGDYAPYVLDIICKDGSTRQVEVNTRLIYHEGKAVGVSGIARDMTERLATERALRASEARFRTVVENSADVVLILDLEGRIEYGSPGITSRLGWNIEEAIGKSAFDFVHPEDHEAAKLGVQRGLYEPREYGPIQLRVGTESGKWMPFEVASLPIKEGGKPVALVVNMRYLGDRHESEAALRASEERYRQLFERNLAGVFLTTLEGEFLDCNDSFAQILGYRSRHELLTKPVLTVYISAQDREHFIETLLRRKNITNLEERLRRRDGSEIWVLQNVSLLEENGRRLIQGTLIDITERKFAEQALIESEFKFRAVADTASSAIYIHDGTRFLYVNRASETISGYSSEELRKMSPWALVHPDVMDEIRKRGTDRLQGEHVPQRYEFKIRTKSGEARWLDFSASTIFFEGHQALLCVAMDVTERKRSEQLHAALYRISEQSNSAEDLDSLYAEIHGIVGELMSARNFYIAVVDDQRKQISFPYFVDEHDDKPETRELRKGLTEYVMRTGKPLLADREQLQALFNSGEVERIGSGCLDWMGVPLRAGNEVYGAMALQTYDPRVRYEQKECEILTFVSRHIAAAIDRKRQAEALRDSEQRNRSLIESAVYGIYRSSVEDRFVDVNPAMVKMLGYDSVEELLAVSISKEIYSDPAQRQELINKYRNIENIEGVEVKWRRKDGRIITARLSGRSYADSQGKTAGFEMIAEDITERRTLEEQLRQSQKMEAVGRLAGGIAHDFNNLLTVIKGYSELILDELPQPDPMRSEVEEIRRAAERAATLTRQLLAFSRQQVLEPKVIDLNGVVTNMDKLLRRLLGEDIQFSTALDAQLGRVKADPGQVEQVIMNLAVNARDAMPKGGKLTIETMNVDLDENYARDHVAIKPGPYVMIAVTDSGTGMSEKVRNRIFEPFFTTKEVGKGTGLGLSTVYGIVKQSEGYIWVYSEPGMGSTFKVYFPRVDAPVAPVTPKAPAALRYTGTETILLVEDEDGVRALVRQVLQKHGYTVLEARHGGEALLACERHPEQIHLLLSDVVLEQMSGPELAKRLLEARPDMRVLFVSGYADDAIVHHGVLAPGVEFLQKPFTSESLARKVRGVLDGVPAN